MTTLAPPPPRCRSGFPGALLAALLILLGAASPLSAQTVNASITSISVTSGDYVIAADASFGSALYNRDRISTTANLSFQRTSGSGTTVLTYRLRYQLLDPNDNPVSLIGPTGTSVTTYTGPDFQVSFINNNPLSRIRNQNIRPGEVLDPNTRYKWRVELHRVLGISTILLDTRDATPRNFLHFPSTNSNDPERNVLVEFDRADFTKLWAIRNDPDPSDRNFRVEISFKLHRYDSFNDPTPDTDLITTRFNYDLQNFNPAGNVPLVDEVYQPGFNMNEFAVSTIKVPYVRNLTITLELEPTIQLNSVIGAFLSNINLSHQEIKGGAFVSDGTETSNLTNLLHYNGELRANGDTLTIDTMAAGSWGVNFIVTGGGVENTALNASGHVTGKPTHTWNDSLPLLLFPDGHAEFRLQMMWIDIDGPDPDTEYQNHILFVREGVYFTENGLFASDLRVRLPAGLGYYEASLSSDPVDVYESILSAEDVALRPSLRPQPSIMTFSSGPFDYFHMVEESKPIIYIGDTISWRRFTGTFELSGAPAAEPVRYVRKRHLAALAAAPIPSPDKQLRSNELVFQHVDSTVGVISFDADANESAKTTARINLTSGAFTSHFPDNVYLKWQSPGLLDIRDDIPSPEDSFLPNVVDLAVHYSRDCESSIALGCGTIGSQAIAIEPSGNELRFTEDGGLVARGILVTAADSRRDAQISFIDAASNLPSTEIYAHDTSAFSKANFLMAGHFLSTDGDVGSIIDTGASTILLSGVNTENPASISEQVVERPGTQAYLDGLGDYPGMNLRASLEPATITANSYLGGNATGNYDLESRSKFYLRPAGTSGILDPASVPNVNLYSYDATLYTFGLSFLDSEVHESIVDGKINLPFPSDHVFEFESLQFDCLGRPTAADLTNQGLLSFLDYWNADFFPQAFRFEPAAGYDCDPSLAFLTVGVGMYATNTESRLAGTLVFNPDGTLATGADPLTPEGLDSRLVLPTQMQVAGPGTLAYNFSPAHNAYLDDYQQNVATTPDGRLNLLGLLDVPFFEDLPVHMKVDPDFQPIGPKAVDLVAGWTEADGDSPVNSNDFDLDHTGYPDNDTLANYLDPEVTAAGELPLCAKQDWLDVIDFNYPLSWSRGSYTFKSVEPLTNDFFVLTTFHELTYMNPETAELDFGANLDLQIPEINLENITATALDAVTSTLQDQISGAASNATGSLLDGLDAAGDLLNDQMEEFYDTIFDNSIAPLIDALYAEIAAANGDLALIQAAVENYMCSGTGQITLAIQQAGDMAGNVVAQVDDTLARMQVAIRAVIGVVEFDQFGEIIIPDDLILEFAEQASDAVITDDTINGLFAKENDVYNTAEYLLNALIDDLAGELALNLASLASNELNEQLNALLAEAEPTIEQVKETLLEIHNALGQIREQLDPASGSIFAQIVDTFSSAATTINNFMDDAKADVLAFFDQIEIPEYTSEEIKALILSEIRDRFNSSDLITSVQEVLRQYIYDLDSLMQEAISSLFAEANRIIAAAIAQYLPASEALDSFLGDLAGIGAAAQIEGYAEMNGDALRKLRLDAALQLQLPDDFGLSGFVEINQLDSNGDDGCAYAGEDTYAAECIIGANDIGVSWGGNDLRFNVAGKFSFDTADGFRLRGMGGSFEMTEGEIGIEAITITDLAAAAMFGLDENYIAASVGLKFDQYIMSGGVFFGRACTLDPLLFIDPDLENVLGDVGSSFTGIYTFGEGQFPIFGASCLFSLQVIAGAGIFVFEEGPIVGGKMVAGAVGKALCAVEIGGRVELIGAKTENDFNFFGRGTLFGSVGACPLCIEFNESVEITFSSGEWDYDF